MFCSGRMFVSLERNKEAKWRMNQTRKTASSPEDLETFLIFKKGCIFNLYKSQSIFFNVLRVHRLMSVEVSHKFTSFLFWFLPPKISYVLREFEIQFNKMFSI